jgi:hypothetical protein
MTPDEEKAVVLGRRILDLLADSGADPFAQLHALLMVTASSAATLGVSLEAARCAMHAFMNPRGAGNAEAAANVINLDKRRTQG